MSRGITLKSFGEALRGGRQVGTTALSYAGIGRRFFGWFIDNVILVTFNILMLTLFVVAMTVASDDFELRALLLHELAGASVGAWTWSVFEPIIVTLYFMLHWYYFGATPGQWLMDVQVVSTDLEPISFGQAFLRWIGFALSTVTAGLGFLWALFDPHQQGIHDKMGRTVVLRRSELEEFRAEAEEEYEAEAEEIAHLERKLAEEEGRI